MEDHIFDKFDNLLYVERWLLLMVYVSFYAFLEINLLKSRK